MTDDGILNIRKKAQESTNNLMEKVKNLSPYHNLAAKDAEGNYLIPEYGEYLKYNNIAFMAGNTSTEMREYVRGMQNAI